MTFSYSGDPGASTLDLVRFLIQDTNEDDAQLQDAEILYWISEFDGEAYSAAISCVSSLIGRFSSGSSESKKVGDLSLTRNQGDVIGKYESLIKYLERERFRRFPAAPAANPNALLPTGEGIVEGEGTDFYTGQMDNNT
jgi:hypothetical protein